MEFHQVILNGSRVMLIFAKWFHVFHKRTFHKQGDYRIAFATYSESCNWIFFSFRRTSLTGEWVGLAHSDIPSSATRPFKILFTATVIIATMFSSPQVSLKNVRAMFSLNYSKNGVIKLSRAMRKSVLCHMRTTKAQISLRIRAVWSAPLFFPCLDSIISLDSIAKISRL